METPIRHDLKVVDYLRREVLTPPEVIAQWSYRLRRDERRHHGQPFRLRSASDDDLLSHLASYAVDDLTPSSRTL